jgi:hypothetical protein
MTEFSAVPAYNPYFHAGLATRWPTPLASEGNREGEAMSESNLTRQIDTLRQTLMEKSSGGRT